MLDGKICCLERDGRSNCHSLLFRRDWPYFYAFDALPISVRLELRLFLMTAAGRRTFVAARRRVSLL